MPTTRKGKRSVGETIADPIQPTADSSCTVSPEHGSPQQPNSSEEKGSQPPVGQREAVGESPADVEEGPAVKRAKMEPEVAGKEEVSVPEKDLQSQEVTASEQ